MSAPNLSGYAEAEEIATFELTELLHRAAAERFERLPFGCVCANGSIPSVWDASMVQVDPDRPAPSLEELLGACQQPARWFPQLSHRNTMIGGSGDDRRELAFSLARRGWEVDELWMMSCRVPPRVPAGARQIGGEPMRRLKGRLGIEQGSPPESADQFDRFEVLRSRRAARLTFAGYDGATAAALATVWIRGDIAMIEDVATLSRHRGHGLGSGAVLAATAEALRVGARAVTLFCEPEVGRGFYERLGFERIGGAWDCKLTSPPEPGGTDQIPPPRS